MLQSIKSLIGFSVIAVDGEVGRIEDVFFDDAAWTVRYFVVRCGSFFARKHVLISPHSVTDMDIMLSYLRTDLTKQRVEESPDIETDLPVTRHKEEAYTQYYSLPQYWIGPFSWGPFPFSTYLEREDQSSFAQSENAKVQNEKSIAEVRTDTHLQSAHDVLGHKVATEDDVFGNVSDLLINLRTWEIKFLVVSTANWWPSKSVLVGPSWVRKIDWIENVFQLALPKQVIMNAPAYNAKSTEEALEMQVVQYFDKHRQSPHPTSLH